jgi:hypothetical protein
LLDLSSEVFSKIYKYKYIVVVSVTQKVFVHLLI